MSWWRSKSVITQIVVLVAAGSVVAACSSGGGAAGGGSAADSGASSAPGPAGSVITIGVAAAETGVTASLWADSAKIPAVWADYTNAHGGIAGHKVQVVVEDSKSDPASGLAAVQDLVQNKHAVAVMTLDTAAETSMANYLQTQNVPLLGINFDQSIVGKPGVFNVTSSVPGFAGGTVLAAKNSGASTFGAVYCIESPACEQATVLYKAVSSGLGIQYAGQLPVSATASSFTAQCLSLMGKGVNYLEVDVASSVQARVTTDCLKQGYKGVFGVVASEVSIPTYSSVTGSTWFGTLNAFPWWVDAPAVVAYRNAIKEYDSSIDYHAASPSGAWTTLQMFAKALSTGTGPVTPASVVTAYGSVKNETLDGLLAAPVSFTAGTPTASPSCYWIFKYVAGQTDPALIHSGSSGNGTTGDLASSCTPAS